MLGQFCLLQLDADGLLDDGPVPQRIGPEHPDPAGVRSPATHSTVVVLPAPFGPSTPKISPSSTSNDTSTTAGRPAYALAS